MDHHQRTMVDQLPSQDLCLANTRAQLGQITNLTKCVLIGIDCASLMVWPPASTGRRPMDNEHTRLCTDALPYNCVPTKLCKNNNQNGRTFLLLFIVKLSIANGVSHLESIHSAWSTHCQWPLMNHRHSRPFKPIRTRCSSIPIRSYRFAPTKLHVAERIHR